MQSCLEDIFIPPELFFEADIGGDNFFVGAATAAAAIT
jgi:hypothetical protein